VPDSQTGVFKAHDGAQIFCRASSVPAPIGSILFVHGLGDHSGWFEPLAAAANGRGLDWCGIDLRGHGRSAGKQGHVESLDDVLRDLNEIRSRLASGGVPIVLGGHSLGGLLALRYSQEHPADLTGLLLVAPFLAVAARVPIWKRVAARLAKRLVPGLTMDNGLDHADLISDADALAAHESDPLTHHRISARLWAEILVAQKAAGRPSPLPVLFQLAGDDRAIRTASAQRLCEAWVAPSRCVVYPGALHDLYHDRVAGQTLADAVDWVATVCDPALRTRSQRDDMKRRESSDEPVSPDKETAADVAPSDAGVGPGEFDVPPEQISAEIREELRELDELRDRHLRVVAEFENYRKRTRRELGEARQQGQGDIAAALLEVLDDLDRFATIPVAQTTVEALHEGVELVNRKLRKHLGDAGMKKVEAGDGVVFSPAVHEALLTANVEDPALDDRISRVFSPGYLFGERLLRPAQVEVQQYREEAGGDASDPGAATGAGADSEA